MLVCLECKNTCRSDEAIWVQHKRSKRQKKNKREFVVDDYQDEIIQVIQKDTFNKQNYNFGRYFRYLKNYTSAKAEKVDGHLK